MKKVLSFASLLFILSLLVGNSVLAQNIGSLKTVVTPGFSFEMDLYPGYTDQDVVELQRVLNADVDTIVSYEGDGSRGHETTYFGDKTKQAVIKFQEKYADVILTPSGLTRGNGIVGKATRTKLNLLIGVINTYESTGSPTSRGNSGTSSQNSSQIVVGGGVPVVVSNPVPTSPSSICDLVNILVDADVISSSLRNQALSVLGCPVNQSIVYPSVSIEANGKGGTLEISSPREVTISWDSEDATECYDSSNSSNTKSLSGSKKVQINQDSRLGITCRNKYGSASDYVTIDVLSDNSNNNASTTLSATCSASAVTLGTATTWRVTASGGYGSSTYAYAYTFVNNSGVSTTTVSRSNYFPYTYTATGTKNMNVLVSSNELNKTISCSPAVVNSLPSYGGVTYSASTTNKVLSASGKSGEMLSVKQSSSLNLTNKMTLEAWVKPTEWASEKDATSLTSDNVIISKGDLSKDTLEYALALDNGKLVYHNRTSAIWSCSAVVPLDEWTHVAVSIDETSSRTDLYINGQKVTSVCQGSYGLFAGFGFAKNRAITEYASTTSSSASNSSSTSSIYSQNTSPRNLHIANYYVPACSAEPTTNGFVGKIDDVRVWNIARTDADILNNATSSVASTTGLVAEYNFDDYSAKDLSKYANNGFQKGGIQITEDKASPSYVASSSLNLYTSYSYTTSFLSDPDGACYAPATEPEEPMVPEEGAEYTIPFAGIVTEIASCEPRNKFDGKLWQVAIAPCKAGDQVTGTSSDGTSAMPSTEPGYIVIREGMQPVPNVGDSVKGKGVPDHGQICKDGINGRWIGTVTGHLGAGPTSSGACDSADAAKAVKTAKENGGSLLGDTAQGAAVGAAVGAALGSIIPGAGTVAGAIGGAEIGAGIGAVTHLLGW